MNVELLILVDRWEGGVDDCSSVDSDDYGEFYSGRIVLLVMAAGTSIDCAYEDIVSQLQRPYNCVV